MGGLRPRAGGLIRPQSTAQSTECEIWGVLNVTPDSFSDGGRFLSEEAAVLRARTMLGEGADVIDVGGASSRPPGSTYGRGAELVSIEEELARIEPVVARLVALGARVSVDTTRGAVAQRAAKLGATILNDVSMGADPSLVEVAARYGTELVLMHTRGDGRIEPSSTDYGADLVATVASELRLAVERVVAAGVPAERVWIDPGIGFAKTPRQSAALLSRLAELGRALPQRILVGASKKSFIAALASRADGSAPPPSERLAGSLVAVAAAVRGGARAVRVHDVAESLQAVRFEASLRASNDAVEPERASEVSDG